MITLRGKLTRTLVARRPISVPKATRSSVGVSAAVVVDAADDVNTPPAASLPTTATAAAVTTTATKEGGAIPSNDDLADPSSMIAGDINDEDALNEKKSSVKVDLAEYVHHEKSSATSSVSIVFPGKEDAHPTNDTTMGEGDHHHRNNILGEGTAAAGTGVNVVGAEEELVEEWTWRGIWAFGDLADDDGDDDDDDNDAGEDEQDDDDEKNNNNGNNKEDIGDANEGKVGSSDAVLSNNADIHSSTNHDDTSTNIMGDVEIKKDDNLIPPTNINNTADEEVVEPSANPTNVSSTTIVAGDNDGEVVVIADSTTTTKKRPGRKRKKQRKNDKRRRRPTTESETAAALAEASTKPRPFVYKWLKPVNASEVVVPSAMVILVRELDEVGGGVSSSGGMHVEEAGVEEKKSESTQGGSDGTTTAAALEATSTKTATDGDAMQLEECGGIRAADPVTAAEEDVVMLTAMKDSDGEAQVTSSDAVDTDSRIPGGESDSGNADVPTVSASANIVDPLKNDPTHPSSTTSRLPSKEIKMKTYGDSPFTDASSSYPTGTCPGSGKWEGHFENVIANTQTVATSSSSHSKKKRSHSRSVDTRVREMFYLFFNSTPPLDARNAFSDTDSTIIANEMLDDKTSTNIVDDVIVGDGDNVTMEDGVIAASSTTTGDDQGRERDKKTADGLLPSSHIHVRGYGTNRFGTFEIVGSLNPTTGTLKCQRMYVPVPTAADISKICGKDVRFSGRFILPGENEDGGGRRTAGRKRKSSWKKRESDIGATTGSGGEYVIGPVGDLGWWPGSGGEVGGTSEGGTGSGSIDIASIVKKRPRQSNDSTGSNRSAASSAGGVVGGGILKPPPQCRGTDNGPFNLQISSGNSVFAPGAKPSPRTASTTGGGGSGCSGVSSKKSHKKKSKGGVVTGAHPRLSSSSAYNGMQGSMKFAPPPSVIPTLPSAGDPLLARWRAAHYLYFQRVEQEPDSDGQSSSWASTTPASSGRASAGRVKINYVVYEGEMHDGMRDGRGVCLYNNNTLYEGQWKKNKEHGIGKLMTADRKYTIYDGSWEKGKMHGYGSYNYYLDSGHGPKENGKYVGQFRQSLRNGRGVYTLPNGSVFDGEFRDNIQNGYGIFRWPDGSTYSGPWRDGKRHGGHGILVASDGFRYEGSWVNNTMEGRGVAVYPKGQIYDGTWMGGRREGRGTIRFTNGAVYEGRFKDDYMEGQGTMKMNRNVIIPKLTIGENETSRESHDKGNAASSEAIAKHDWMIPLQFQSDISHIHQKAGFTQLGL